MISKQRLFLSLAAGVMIASCENDDITSVLPDTHQGEYVRLHSSTADGDATKTATRAVWADPNGSGSLVFNWEADDKGTEMVALLSDGSAFVRNYSSENRTDEDLQEAL